MIIDIIATALGLTIIIPAISSVFSRLIIDLKKL